MSSDLRVPFPVSEENGLTTWHTPGRAIASRLYQTWGPAVTLEPVKGWLRRASYDKILCDHETKLNLPLSLNRYLTPQIRAKEFDLHINLLDLALSVHKAFQGQVPERLCQHL